jgi:hypothetical protein
MTVRETLINARKLLVEKGWTQEAWMRVDGMYNDWAHVELDEATCYCSAGAVAAACSVHPEELNALDCTPQHVQDAIKVLANEIRKRTGSNTEDDIEVITIYNDHNTLEEMLDVFDKAIES